MINIILPIGYSVAGIKLSSTEEYVAIGAYRASYTGRVSQITIPSLKRFCYNNNYVILHQLTVMIKVTYF